MLLEKIEHKKSALREEIKDILAYKNQESAEESVKRGKALRKTTPRTSHAQWKPSLYRMSPVKLLKSQELTRVPELIPVRHEREWLPPLLPSSEEVPLLWQATYPPPLSPGSPYKHAAMLISQILAFFNHLNAILFLTLTTLTKPHLALGNGTLNALLQV